MVVLAAIILECIFLHKLLFYFKLEYNGGYYIFLILCNKTITINCFSKMEIKMFSTMRAEVSLLHGTNYATDKPRERFRKR